MSDIRRIYATTTVAIPAGSSLSSTPIDMRRVAGGIVEMSASWTTAGLGFKISSGSAVGNAQLFYDKDASIVQIKSPSVSIALEMPASLYAARYVWLYSQDNSGTAVDQVAEASLTVQLKS